VARTSHTARRTQHERAAAGGLKRLPEFGHIVTEHHRDPRSRWNSRFAQRGVSAFQDAPATWLVEHRSLLLGSGKGRALDVACGNGRNAGYLAGLGYEVDAVDISDVAIEALRAAAIDRGLKVYPRRMDLEQERLPVASYNVIVQINYLQRDLFESLAHALKPGGLLLLETFTRADGEELCNRVPPRFLLEHQELLSAFPDLEVLDHVEALAERSGRRRGVAGLVARRPAGL
jgi:tellurite methyltransferase